MELKNRKWTEEELFAARKEVLAQYPTGKDLEDIDELIEYQRQIPDKKRSSVRADQFAVDGKVQIASMIGIALVEQMTEHMTALEDLAPHWTVHPDMYTRSHLFDQVNQAIERSRKEGRSILNGFPVINHGLKGTRTVTECVSNSLCVNVSDTDHRLLAEMCIAGGFTALTTHSLNDIAQHTRDCPLGEKIIYSQYINRLAAYYTDHGATIMVAHPGNLTGWDVPAFRVAMNVLEALLSAEQGVKYIQGGLCNGTHLVQDVAAFRVLAKVARDYLDRAGYKDVKYHEEAYGWLGSWPRDPDRASAVNCWHTLIPIMAGTVNLVMLKGIDEGVSIFSISGNRTSLLEAMQLVDMMGDQRLPESEELKLEEKITEMEVRAVVDKVLELGDGDVAKGMVKAIDVGVLDTAFSPWRYFKGNVLYIRDKSGGIRYLDHGNLPLPKEAIDYHKQKVAEREKAEGIKADIETVIEDLTRYSRPYVAKV